MNVKYNNIQWVVQRNLTSQSDFERLRFACLEIGVSFVAVDVIPFSAGLPEFDRSRESIIYGSTTFTGLAYQDSTLRKGLFFDERSFSIENYLQRWGRSLLNYGAAILRLEDLVNSKQYAPEKLLFIRPDDDNKSFAGEVKRFNEIVDWFESIRAIGITNLSPDTKLVVSEPYNIQYEWRLWIVKGEVVAASKYREFFNLKKEEGCPVAVVSFAEERCFEYTPHDIFVMDVCLCGDEYFIVECGCMNGAGFYAAKIDKIVSAVSEYVAFSM